MTTAGRHTPMSTVSSTLPTSFPNHPLNLRMQRWELWGRESAFSDIAKLFHTMFPSSKRTIGKGDGKSDVRYWMYSIHQSILAVCITLQVFKIPLGCIPLTKLSNTFFHKSLMGDSSAEGASPISWGHLEPYGDRLCCRHHSILFFFFVISLHCKLWADCQTCNALWSSSGQLHFNVWSENSILAQCVNKIQIISLRTQPRLKFTLKWLGNVYFLMKTKREPNPVCFIDGD